MKEHTKEVKEGKILNFTGWKTKLYESFAAALPLALSSTRVTTHRYTKQDGVSYRARTRTPEAAP